jgi:hypothetical protein
MTQSSTHDHTLMLTTKNLSVELDFFSLNSWIYHPDIEERQQSEPQ